MFRSFHAIILTGFVFLLWGCTPGMGQIGGVATDANGKVLSFAEVHLGEHMTTTNVQGQYQLIDIQPGFYYFKVLAKGFYTHEAIVDVLSGVQRVDVALTPQPERVQLTQATASAKGSGASTPEPASQSEPETVTESPTVQPSTEAQEETSAQPTEVIIPDFKLPLPGGYDWLLSTEPGGGFYGGDPNLGHRGRAYFAMDIIDNNRQQGELHGFPVPVLAAADGVVTEIRNTVICQACEFGYGNFVRVDHGNGFTAVYAHLRYPSVSVDPGDKVRQGQVLGFMGNTGHSTGIHLHFEIRYLNEGIKQADVLNGVMMDGLSLSRYKVGTVSRPKYYTSSQKGP